MNRRSFLERLIAPAFAFGAVLFLSGCGKQADLSRPGNQDKLWKLATGAEIPEVPLQPSYVKDTPVFYRDASLGKVDPSFTPKTGGG
jgi:hypothetical protein